MKRKIINLLDDFFDWLDEKNIHIGDLEFYHIIIHRINGKRERHIGFCPNCENCYFSWEYRSYEGECEDCGCYIDYEFNTPKFYCAIPWRIKKLIKKLKRWD